MGKGIKGIKKKVLRRITPSKKENRKELSIAGRLEKKIERMRGKHVEVILAGSLARNTHLKGDKDIDLFILFDKALPREKFVREGLRIAKQAIKGKQWEIDYGEHPYLKTKVEGHEVELVPSYKISDPIELQSSVDRSPFHNAYLKARLDDGNRKDIRIFKRFLKGINCYGAELKVQGFSGYLCEVLVLYYGSFERVLKNAVKWKKAEIIDLERHYNKKDYGEVKKKFVEPLIVVDPVDRRRNAAAAVSTEKVNLFREKARLFLKKPSMEFFFPKAIKVLGKKELKTKLDKREILLVELPYKKVHEDVTFGQLRRLLKKLSKELERNDFRVIKEDFWSDELKKMVLLIELKKLKLGERKIHTGPPLKMKEHRKRFLEKHGGKEKAIVKKGKIQVVIQRKHVHAKTVIEESFEQLVKQSPAKFIAKQVKKEFSIMEKEEILSIYGEKELKQFITEFLE
ncbi:MAG: CCA tRNA nucleotidyltransferase [archaeon]|nr:CCA tRNA nucleotidyltransferase [Candidatus Micrarchaeota archaeon]